MLGENKSITVLLNIVEVAADTDPVPCDISRQEELTSDTGADFANIIISYRSNFAGCAARRIYLAVLAV